jgi:hypothetical protein
MRGSFTAFGMTFQFGMRSGRTGNSKGDDNSRSFDFAQDDISVLGSIGKNRMNFCVAAIDLETALVKRLTSGNTR